MPGKLSKHLNPFGQTILKLTSRFLLCLTGVISQSKSFAAPIKDLIMFYITKYGWQNKINVIVMFDITKAAIT
jgi:hypothetical protein